MIKFKKKTNNGERGAKGTSKANAKNSSVSVHTIGSNSMPIVTQVIWAKLTWRAMAAVLPPRQ